MAMNDHVELELQFRRYQQVATPAVLAVVHTVADNGYPSSASGAQGSTGSGACTCGDHDDSLDPARCPHGTATERAALGADIEAAMARALLARIDRLHRGQFVEHEVVALVRYIADDLETYDPARNETIECVHCRERRDRSVDECPACGIPAEAWQCRNPHHGGYVVGPARNGMCEPCDRYLRRTGRHRPADLCSKADNARRTSDTQLVDCLNPNCPDTLPYDQLRDGRCPPCAGHWNSLGRERIPQAALALGHNVKLQNES